MPDSKVSALTPASIVGIDDILYLVQSGVSKKCVVSQIKESFLQVFNEVLVSGINTINFGQSMGSSTSDYDYIANLFDSDGNAYYNYTIEKIDENSISVTVADDNVNIKLVVYIL